ncbi:MAG TPA: hypothetical protein VGZ47_22030 [Gemmataceae bacterium]|jgi:NADH:ubiquinone oxidoreductase subunit 6 (subunit J)|nr:hypothetical protein [Gemmataceae bacterium]
MDFQPPPPTQPPKHFHVMVYIMGIVFAFCLAAAFLYLLFGEAFLLAMAVITLIGAVGAFHWFTWGKRMTEQAEEEKFRAEQEGIEVE